MFPIAEATLSLHDIAEYWSREIHPPASWQEVFQTLESAWWLAELRGNSGRTRLQLLKNMFTSMRHRDDLGIVFIAGSRAAPPPVKLPDKSLKVDLRHQIRVPSANTDSWDEAACSEAFRTLAKTCSVESYPDYAPYFSSIQLSYQEFNTWRAKRGYDVAGFWKPRDKPVAPHETWRPMPGGTLSRAQHKVLEAINELWPDGNLDHKAKARDKRIQDWLKLTQQSTVSSRTIQRTLGKIHFA